MSRHMKQAMEEAKRCNAAFSWLSTRQVNQHWSAHYAAIGFWETLRARKAA